MGQDKAGEPSFTSHRSQGGKEVQREGNVTAGVIRTATVMA